MISTSRDGSKLSQEPNWERCFTVIPSLSNLAGRHLVPVLRAAGIQGEPDAPSHRRLTLYTLRHTHATLLLLAGLNPKVIAERLGHTGIAMTLSTYSHVLPSMQEAAADQFERVVYRPIGQVGTPVVHHEAAGGPALAPL